MVSFPPNVKMVWLVDAFPTGIAGLEGLPPSVWKVNTMMRAGCRRSAAVLELMV